LKGDKEMRKYKTGEAIAMLENNPEAKFKRGNLILYLGQFEHFHVKQPCGVNSWECVDGLIKPSDEWELIQQAIPFMEAVKAYSEGKPVDCEICGKVWHYNPNSIPKDSSLGYHLVVTNKCGTSPSITTEEILRGKWTIAEDSNE
jgi:hypothetical protein